MSQLLKIATFGVLGKKKKKDKKKKPEPIVPPPTALFNSETDNQETLARKTVLGGF